MKRPLMLAPLGLLALTMACSAGQTSGSQSRGEAAASTSAPSVALTGRVTDTAEILAPAQKARLSAKLEKLERETGHQMVVATVRTLGGQDIATFTRNLANAWGIGRKDYNDGVVLLVAPNERKARIAVGLGLEKALPDALCRQIMDEQMLPRFREGDLSAGIEAGVDALIARLS